MGNIQTKGSDFNCLLSAEWLTEQILLEGCSYFRMLFHHKTELPEVCTSQFDKRSLTFYWYFCWTAYDFGQKKLLLPCFYTEGR